MVIRQHYTNVAMLLSSEFINMSYFLYCVDVPIISQNPVQLIDK